MKLKKRLPKFTGKNEKDQKLKKLLFSIASQYEKETGSLKGGRTLLIKASVMLLLYLVPYILILYYSPNAWLAIPLLAVLAFGKVGVALNVMHDAAHESFSEKKWINATMEKVILLLGDSLLLWKIQHNYFHHRYTNIQGTDEDLHAPEWLLRFSSHIPWKKNHQYQHIYGSFAYGFLTIGRFLGEINRLLSYSKMDLPSQYQFKLKGQILKIISLKVIYCFMAIVLPILITDYTWWQVFLAFFSIHYFPSIFVSFVFQTAHLVKGVEQYPEITEGSDYELNAIVHQILTTSNFKTNRFLSWYIGGLNYQILHHIFPRIAHIHYQHLEPKIRKAILQAGYTYNEINSFIQACISHLYILKAYGIKP